MRGSGDINARSHVDLDLSITTPRQRYGWNSSKDGEVRYSGDMTAMQAINSTTQSASEIFRLTSDDVVGVLDVSSFAFGSNTTKVELFIGDIILPIEKPTSTTVLGFIVGGRFYVNIDNRLNAKISSVRNNTVTDNDSFRGLFLTNTYTL